MIAAEGLTQGSPMPATTPVRYLDVAGPRVKYLDAIPYLDAGHFLDVPKFVEPTWDYKPLETALSQVPRTFRQAESFRRLLADVSDVGGRS